MLQVPRNWRWVKIALAKAGLLIRKDVSGELRAFTSIVLYVILSGVIGGTLVKKAHAKGVST
jgi:hypothetical protein